MSNNILGSRWRNIDVGIMDGKYLHVLVEGALPSAPLFIYIPDLNSSLLFSFYLGWTQSIIP